MAAGKTGKLDDLIARLRARAADPERRAESRPGASMSEMRRLGSTVSLREFGGMTKALRGGRIDPDLVAKAETFVTKMTTRRMPDLSAPATPAQLDAAEGELDLALPAGLRRIYAEVANGGFGPGAGLMPVEAVVTRYAGLRDESPGPEGCAWPEKLLPIVDRDGDHTCVDAEKGRVVEYDGAELLEEWDPEEGDEAAARSAWRRCLKPGAPSVDAWLAKWADEAKRARARIAAMTPEQRGAMGLPEVGWERVVRGGLGLEDSER